MSPIFNRNPMGIGMGMRPYRRNTGLKTIYALVSVIFAVFFINYPFNFFKVPEAIMKFENWILFAGGILIVIGMINYFRATRRFM